MSRSRRIPGTARKRLCARVGALLLRDLGRLPRVVWLVVAATFLNRLGTMALVRYGGAHWLLVGAMAVVAAGLALL